MFPSCVSRHPDATHCTHESGRLITNGATSIESSLCSAQRYINNLNDALKLDLKLSKFTVRNIHANFAMGYKLDIDRFAHEQGLTSNENFGAVVWRIKGTNQSFCLFQSGRGALMGSASWEQAHSRYTEALPVIAKYRV